MKTVLISGGAGGLGTEIAALALGQGCKVIALVRSVQSAQLLSQKLDNPKQLVVLPVDLNDPSLLAVLDPEINDVDVLINNAGVARPTTVEEAGSLQRIFAVNYFSAVSLIQQVLPGMRQRRQGLIINVSSLSAHIGLLGDGVYSASKAALERTGESLRAEVSPFGVRVVNVVPGAIATPMQQKMKGAMSADSSSPYYLLMEKLMEGVGSGGANANAIAEEIVALVDQPDPPLTVPVGDQARAVVRQLGLMSEARRVELVNEFSDAQWWRTLEVETMGERSG
nr:3-oxoacyl-[acyl-carrier-protein] reductase FabG-like [Nerophis lumbriciformis]